MLLHGLGGGSRCWPGIAEGLAVTRRVLVPDLRGCGRSSGEPSPYSLDLLADDVVAVLDHLGLERCHLVGHSLGGVVAQNVLTRHNRRCASAVLVSTSSRVGDKAAASWSRLADAVERDGLSDSPAARRRAFSDAFAEARPDIVDIVGDVAAASDPRIYAAQARVASTYDFTAQLASVEQPVLVVQGLADRLTSPGGSVIIDRALPASRLEMIDGVGHNAHLEMGDRFIAIVEEFFAAVDEA